MSFPQHCIRGIYQAESVVDSYPSAAIFVFNDNPEREDDFLELSINWKDNDDAIDFTLNQKRRDGKSKFQGGVVLVSRDEIRKIQERPLASGTLDYERKEMGENNYHGNILLNRKAKPRKNTIAGMLANAVELPVIPQINE